MFNTIFKTTRLEYIVTFFLTIFRRYVYLYISVMCFIHIQDNILNTKFGNIMKLLILAEQHCENKCI